MLLTLLDLSEQVRTVNQLILTHARPSIIRYARTVLDEMYHEYINDRKN